MTVLKRIAAVALWTAIMLLIWLLLTFVFLFGDCGMTDSACRAQQEMNGRLLSISIALIYGFGLGAMFGRWTASRKL